MYHFTSYNSDKLFFQHPVERRSPNPNRMSAVSFKIILYKMFDKTIRLSVFSQYDSLDYIITEYKM